MGKKQEIQKSIEKTLKKGPFKPDLKSLEKWSVPDWYIDGKFGIFIHWGVYCVPAFGNEWYPREMYRKDSRCYEHHLKTYGPQDKFGYKDFIPKFKAEKFDAGEWAKLFKDAGAKFVVPVAEHHDGFAMYETELNRWNSAKMGPKRDIVGELAKAVGKEGLVFGLSSHREEHYWFFDGGLDIKSDVQDPAFADLYGPVSKGPANGHNFHQAPPSKEFLEDWLVRTCELVDKYHPQLVWFDWWINQFEYGEYLKKFTAYLYNRAHERGEPAAVNYKNHALTPGSAVFDIERGQLKEIYPRFWQNDTSVSKNSWGYIEGQDYKTSADIVSDLVDIISKNGALLLNIGPKADGTIPEPEQKMLREIGDWLKVNGEAVYGSRPWTVFGEGPTQVAEGAFTDTKRAAFTSSDIRFTQNNGNLYVIPMAVPADGVIRVRTLEPDSNHCPDKIRGVELLGHGKIKWRQEKNEGATFELPAREYSRMPAVIKLTR
jgi:alpha-L-fucosidase